KFEEIQDIDKLLPGDFIIWPSHTALFTGYDEDEERLTVSHTTSYPGVSGTLGEDYSKSYYNGKKAKYFRPVQETIDKHVYVGQTLEEVVIYAEREKTEIKLLNSQKPNYLSSIQNPFNNYLSKDQLRTMD
ncbi:MAG TPA: hypothetical protein VK856_05930, partial [Anaerolineaceae bacterium]|nr:hypothetical protein [Anaerolineaceae bacterium]